MSNQVCFVAVSSSKDDAKWQIEWQGKNGSGTTGLYSCPAVLDLSTLNLDADSTFVVHDQVGDQHKHSDSFTYSPTGGLLTAHIKDSQGHYDDWTQYQRA